MVELAASQCILTFQQFILQRRPRQNDSSTRLYLRNNLVNGGFVVFQQMAFVANDEIWSGVYENFLEFLFDDLSSHSSVVASGQQAIHLVANYQDTALVRRETV